MVYVTLRKEAISEGTAKKRNNVWNGCVCVTFECVKIGKA